MTLSKHSRPQRIAWRVIAAGLVVLAIVAAFKANAQTVLAPTRVTPYDFQCVDANGALISNHQQQGLAIVACYNNPNGAFVQGGRYRINRPAPPEPEPEPEPPVVELTAPTLTGSLVANTADPTRSNVTLTWTAVEGAASYEVERCTGAGCSSFARIATPAVLAYANTGLPGGFSLSYRVRALEGARSSPYSNVVAIVTPTAATGAATIEWTPPTTNTDGSALTDLAGFRIYYGNLADQLHQTAEVENPGISSHVINGLSSGAWYFAVAAYTTAGAESANSNVASKQVIQ